MSKQPPNSTDQDTPDTVAIWDRAVRAWHWLIVLAIPAMWLTAEYRWFAIHRTLGILVTALVIFRLYWAVFGSRTARATDWVASPMTIIGYVRTLAAKGYARTVGHNPLGGLSVLALMLALLVQVVSGLFAVDTDGMNSGPLSRFVDFDTGRTAAEIHETAFNVLLALIVLHILAVMGYAALKRVNLVGPMLTGRTQARGRANTSPHSLVFVTGITLAALAAAWLYTL